MFALAGALAGAYFGLSWNSQQQEQGFVAAQRLTLPGLTPVALADAAPPRSAPAAQPAASAAAANSTAAATASISLTGFEDVKDANGFVASALEKVLRGGGRGGGRDSPLAALLGIAPGGAPSTSSFSTSSSASSGSGAGSAAVTGGHVAGKVPSGASVLSFGESPGPAAAAAGVEPAVFYELLAKQPLYEKVLVLDEVVDGLIAEAERGAEAAGLAVGLLGGGVACYALLGWWTDLALPGAGTVTCSAVAGAAGHYRAKLAAQRTRRRFLSFLLNQQPSSSAAASPGAGRPVGLSNSFLAYLAAPTLAEKQRLASEVPPADFFADFYAALQPLLRQSKLEADAAGRAVLVQLD
ncbi:hypothetical protein CHLRE_09g402800v5 [Chlamydomonas reinhardtii]|uniref:Uncharacterized protein n=1 Tax=Chlamydomonas reinhardtii TaxID=3055 RepID=A0A2K3DCP3_CHLRE|nr:uncharacterized protein CHLRE_09g402800v5 [Chlamydomonas reinhardtii]PNW78302.1 hypothetical protein CHLRE_09g402800v5 [Chlamydomonas reinhardtii]